MAIDMNTALAKYGWVGQLATSIPELRDVLTRAASAEWSPDEFQRQLEGSPWWQRNADSVRKLAITQATDPATYQQNLNNAAAKVQLYAQQMGRDGVDTNALGLQLLTNNWDDQQLQAVIGNTAHIASGPDGALLGDAAQLKNHMMDVAGSYGVHANDGTINWWLYGIQSGKNSLDGWESSMRQQAKMYYPQFSTQIDAGQTVKDIASPWVQTMAKTLEISDSTITLDDPNIKKALTQRNADGSATAQPLWQFERQLKDDARYDKTTQARTDAYSTLAKVGRDFGFSA
jgi:hypothetical protein